MKVIALLGGSGAGKSTVLRGIVAHFGPRVAVLSLDNYYRPKEELPVDENGETNFDLPEVIDHTALVRDVDRLAAGEVVELRTYTYNRDVIAPEPVRVAPAPLLVVEGLFVLASEEMQRRADVIGYIDAPVDVRLARRIRRDGSERGYTEEEVRYQWQHHVRPADIVHIEPWRSKADVVIDNHHHWQDGLQRLIDRMEQVAQQESAYLSHMPIAPPFNLHAWIAEHRDLLKPPVANRNLYVDSGDYIVMIVAGPNARKDYHFNETEELFYQIEGNITVRIQEDGRAVDMRLGPGDMYLHPARVPHSPMREAGSIGLVIERKRPESRDGLLWFCEQCNHKLHETYFTLEDIERDFLPRFREFYGSEALRTCSACGHVMEADPRFVG